MIRRAEGVIRRDAPATLSIRVPPRLETPPQVCESELEEKRVAVGARPFYNRFVRNTAIGGAASSRDGSARSAIIDTPLLPRIAEGQPDAVEACLERYGALVWALARRFLHNPADAEDAVQDIFIDVWSNASRFDSSVASEKTFIAMIARRRLIDRCRREQARPATEVLPEASEMLADLDADQAAQVETRDEAARVGDLIASLRPEQQQVIKLSIFDSLSHSEIAAQLGLPLGTVKTHIRRGLIEVRRLLDGAAEGAEDG